MENEILEWLKMVYEEHTTLSWVFLILGFPEVGLMVLLAIFIGSIIT